MISRISPIVPLAKTDLKEQAKQQEAILHKRPKELFKDILEQVIAKSYPSS